VGSFQILQKLGWYKLKREMGEKEQKYLKRMQSNRIIKFLIYSSVVVKLVKIKINYPV
jgi:hypothetical protein